MSPFNKLLNKQKWWVQYWCCHASDLCSRCFGWHPNWKCQDRPAHFYNLCAFSPLIHRSLLGFGEGIALDALGLTDSCVAVHSRNNAERGPFIEWWVVESARSSVTEVKAVSSLLFCTYYSLDRTYSPSPNTDPMAKLNHWEIWSGRVVGRASCISKLILDPPKVFRQSPLLTSA